MISCEIRTSSSISKNATDLASFTPCNGSPPFFSSFHPLCPAPLLVHPGTPFAHCREYANRGESSAFEPVPVATMASRSGKPSWFASPNLMGTGTGGLCVVSWTSKYCVCDEPSGEGKTSVIGTLAKFYRTPTSQILIPSDSQMTNSLPGYRWIRSG